MEGVDPVRLRTLTDIAIEEHHTKDMQVEKSWQEEEAMAKKLEISSYVNKVHSELKKLPPQRFYDVAQKGHSRLKITMLVDSSVYDGPFTNEKEACRGVRLALKRIPVQNGLTLVGEPVYDVESFHPFDYLPTDQCEVYVEW
jgi:hypothetical protein